MRFHQPRGRDTVDAGGVAPMGCWMNHILHRVVMGVLLVAALVLFWHLLGR